MGILLTAFFDGSSLVPAIGLGLSPFNSLRAIQLSGLRPEENLHKEDSN